MIEIDCWQSNFKSCVYSDLLINKLTLINEQSANKIDIEEVKKAKKEKQFYRPEIFKNGDTKKQLLARSRYLLFKPKSKWR